LAARLCASSIPTLLLNGIRHIVGCSILELLCNIFLIKR
jgi:hypothetical protein